MAECPSVQHGLIRCRGIGVDGALQVAVEVLVGAELGRGRRWQEEDLDLGGALGLWPEYSRTFAIVQPWAAA